MQDRLSIFSTLNRLKVIVATYWRHHRYGMAIVALIIAPVFIAFTRISLLMDYLFFPMLWKIRVQKPVFIVGHPRSGTTFLQKRIYEADQAAMFTTWEMLFPSLTVRKLLYPIIRGLRFAGVDVLQRGDKGHEIRLDEVEEEEALFLHRLDTEILHILCPWVVLDTDISKTGFRLGWSDFRDSRRSVRLLQEFLKRQIRYSGHFRAVAKLNPSAFRVRTLLEQFPDAKIVYLIRDPEEAIRSFLSFESRYVKGRLTLEEYRKFCETKYQWSLKLYQYFESVKREIPEKSILVVPFDQMVQQTSESLQQFFNFVGITPDTDYWAKLGDRIQRRSKKHSNRALSEFGISKERIQKDLDFIYNGYIFPRC